MDILTYPFEEAPAFELGGQPFGTLSGGAEIEVDEDGDWLINSITLDPNPGGCPHVLHRPLFNTHTHEAFLFKVLSRWLNDNCKLQIDELVACELPHRFFDPMREYAPIRI